MAASVVGTNAHLKVNPSDLTVKASQIQNKINEMEALMKQMNSSFDTLAQSWQSTAGDAYREKATVLIGEVRESLDNLTYYVKDLNDASAKYEDLESTITSNVKALDDPSNIFNV